MKCVGDRDWLRYTLSHLLCSCEKSRYPQGGVLPSGRAGSSVKRQLSAQGPVCRSQTQNRRARLPQVPRPPPRLLAGLPLSVTADHTQSVLYLKPRALPPRGLLLWLTLDMVAVD